MKTRYTIAWTRNGMAASTLRHASIDGYETLCGLKFRDAAKFVITHNNFDGITTCKKCQRLEADHGERQTT